MKDKNNFGGLVHGLLFLAGVSLFNNCATETRTVKEVWWNNPSPISRFYDNDVNLYYHFQGHDDFGRSYNHYFTDLNADGTLDLYKGTYTEDEEVNIHYLPRNSKIRKNIMRAFYNFVMSKGGELEEILDDD